MLHIHICCSRIWVPTWYPFVMSLEYSRSKISSFCRKRNKSLVFVVNGTNHVLQRYKRVSRRWPHSMRNEISITATFLMPPYNPEINVLLKALNNIPYISLILSRTSSMPQINHWSVSCIDGQHHWQFGVRGVCGLHFCCRLPSCRRTGLLITGSLVRTHSGASFVINFASLCPASAWPSLA